MSFVKIAIAEMALQESVNETGQTIAHYSFLALVIEGAIMDGTEGFIDDLTEEQKNRFENNVIAEHLLDALSEEIKNAIPTTGALLNSYVAESVYEAAVRDKYEKKVGSSDFFNASGITVTDHNFPQTRGDSDVVIEVENELRLVFPFFERDIKIKKKTVERAWAGG